LKIHEDRQAMLKESADT